MWHPIFFFSFGAWWYDVFNLVERKYIGNERQMLQVLWTTCLSALQPKQHSSEMSACESQSFLSSRHYHTMYLCSKMFSWSSHFNRSHCSSCNKVALEAMWKSTNHVIIWFGGWDKDISSPSWFLQYCSGLATIFVWTQNEYDWCCIFFFCFPL